AGWGEADQAGMSDASVAVDGEAIGGDGGRAIDAEPAGGVVEGDEIEFAAGGGAEDVGEGDGRGGVEQGCAGRLHVDDESVLQWAVGEEMGCQVGRERADAHLAGGEFGAVGFDEAVSGDFDAQMRSLLRGELWSGSGVGGDGGRAGWGDWCE